MKLQVTIFNENYYCYVCCNFISVCCPGFSGIVFLKNPYKECVMFSTKILKIIPLMTAMAVSSCATRPNDIAASSSPNEKYQAHECSLLDAELKNAQSELAAVMAKQNSAANTDAWLLILSVVPVSVVTGDYEKDVANWKGEVNAIEAAKQKNNCA